MHSCPKAETHRLALTASGQELLLAERDLLSRNSTVSLTLFLKLVISSLTCIILVVLGTVDLQFQGPFAPISSWPVLRVMAAHVWSSVVNFFTLVF